MGNARGAFYARPSASQVGEKRQVEEVDLSFLCLPLSALPLLLASFLVPLRCLTIDGSLIFARERLAISPAASPQQKNERRIYPCRRLSPAINIFHTGTRYVHYIT